MLGAAHPSSIAVPIDATERAREYMTGVQPSSPSIALFKDGQLVYMMQRRDIETRYAEEIAEELTAAFDKHCAPAANAQAN